MKILKQKILEILQLKHNQTGGNCGLYIAGILYFLPDETKPKEVRKTLNELFLEDEITVHKGQHGKLIKIKTNKRCQK